MVKYELTLTKNYASDWNVVDAIREFFQNALDQQTVKEDNSMFWEYENETFKIGNAKSTLLTKSLLLGSSTKTDDSQTIGQFGEGYKIATLVLTRMNKKVTIYNYGAKEVWTASLQYSKKYKTELLVFNVDKKYVWNKVPDNNLTIEIQGITEEEFEEIKNTNLHIIDYDSLKCEAGEVLTNIELRGKMFVNGLYITEVQDFQYGYNFHPSLIKLDRDRKLIKHFDLQWTTSELWAKLKDEDSVKLATNLVMLGSPDVKYLTAANTSHSIKNVADEVVTEFTNKYGSNAIPVTSQEEVEEISKEYKPVIVNEVVKSVMKASKLYEEPTPIYIPSFLDKVELWLITHGDDLEDTPKEELINLIEEEKNKQYEKYPF